MLRIFYLIFSILEVRMCRIIINNKHQKPLDNLILYSRSGVSLVQIIREPEAKKLLTKLKRGKSLFCFTETYDTVHAMTHSINKALKKIMPDLTVYYARHSWATLAINSCKASNGCYFKPSMVGIISMSLTKIKTHHHLI